MLNQEASLDLMFKALADPTRREIIARLAGGEASVSELARPFDMSLPAVHQHLQVIAEAGLMTWSKEGRVRRCRLEPRALDRAAGWIMQRRALWNRRLDALGRHLKEGRKT